MGVRIYVTVNTLVDDEELPAVGEYLCFLSNIGVDGIIVQDMGIIRIARKVAPELPLHASTQMTVTNSAGVMFTYHNGMAQAVPARETSLKELKTICSRTPSKIENFHARGPVHLLQRPVPHEQPDRGPQRQPGTLCPAPAACPILLSIRKAKTCWPKWMQAIICFLPRT